MTETRIAGRDGTITIADSSYGFGSINVGLPARPEPPRVEDKKLDRKQVMRRFNCTDADFEAVQQFGFPGSTDRRHHFGEWTVTLLWRELALNRWAADQREKAELILRLVG